MKVQNYYQITSWSDLFTITIVSCCKRLVVCCVVIIEVLEQIYQGICVRFCQNMHSLFCKSTESVRTTGNILNERLQKFITGLKMNVKVLKGLKKQEDL